MSAFRVRSFDRIHTQRAPIPAWVADDCYLLEELLFLLASKQP